MYDPQVVYSDLKMMLKNRINEVGYTTWFKDLEPLGIEDNTLILGTSEPIAKDIIPKRYADDIKQCFQELNYTALSFKVVDMDSYSGSKDNSSQNKD